MEAKWSRVSYEMRALHLKHLIDFFGPSCRLDSFNRKEAARYAKHRLGKVSNATINKELGTLKFMVKVVAGRVFAFDKLRASLLRKTGRAVSKGTCGNPDARIGVNSGRLGADPDQRSGLGSPGEAEDVPPR